ncbi:putative voltage-dependent calcium channel subunit alpha-2/delta-1 [Triplophysa rosa]|uniref:Voltage-dependent calcium channel subunit alpha-2/delta-1 n=1 Tax=Triplophysa rosa TaxID=992332 RepID=A0A9W7WAI7_TRIRA|nr:putative voltage-dependent calcium channel subunit alpha-2/delta-1 [Triplophysa rosa]
MFKQSHPISFSVQFMTKKWAEQMQEELIQLIDAESGIHTLKEVFLKLRRYYTVKNNNASNLVANAALEIETLLYNRSKALKELASAAEALEMDHQWKDDIDENEVFYYNAKDKFDINDPETHLSQNQTTSQFKEDPDFKRRVSYNTSAVHIPTDIYNGSAIILNELNWTAGLDDVFRKNKEDDPLLLWQVFGSATGLARYFPASPWDDTQNNTNKKIDLYDVRRRPWYIQGAASPKNMLILVDVSGSVSGLTLKLIRTSVSEMLETLSDDDYVNIVSFNSTAKSIACFDSLVQANVRNKKILREAVHKIAANGTTDYKVGLKEAFSQLYSLNISKLHCNKIIMLFTDGGEDRAADIFKEFNNDKNKVRIFTFSVGQHNYDKGPIQWMACENRGYYYEIPSIGAIRINTQEYLDVLGRPMVKARKKIVQWTNVYLDALELGLVITGTLPVFNKTKSTNKNQLILGVMAVDVSLGEIKRVTPRFTLGPNGYYFAIDPNGYVLLHPNLQPKDLKSQEPVTLDFLDAELEDEVKVDIRKNMIDGQKGSRRFHTLIKSHDELYFDSGIRTYTWVPVKQSDYSLALVLPKYSLHYINAAIGDTITQAKCNFLFKDHVNKFEEYGHTFIAPREYCSDLDPQSNSNKDFLKDFNEYIDRKTPNNPLCNINLTNRLLLDAGITAELSKHWSKQRPIRAKFVATDGGVTRVYPESAGAEWTEEAETYECSFYKRSLDNDIYIFTSRPSYAKNGTDESVLVSRAMDLRIDEFMLKPAVVGVKLDVEMWMESFMNVTITSKCNGEICGCKRNDPYLECVLLDDGGFLIMANQDDYISKIGEFFGMIDPGLMRNLMNESLFSVVKTYDYQSLCDPIKETKAAAGLRSVYVVIRSDWSNTASVSMLQQLFVSITFSSYLEAADVDDDQYKMPPKESCITEQTQYFFEDNKTSFKGLVECGNCSRQFTAEKLPKTNLVLIVADYQCEICQEAPFSHNEKPSPGPDPCVIAQNPRYRKGTEACFDDNSRDETVCRRNAGSPLLSSPLMLLLPVFLCCLGKREQTVAGRQV